ncbi:MAG: phenylalanine--tRNA ligase subunit beta [Chloroflexi bacterium]|nr:phenylalanine--tRNA ligase subunit beta [Chloroflexota bacterium]
MKVPLSWLKEFVDITLSPAELAFRLTVAGAEVAQVEYVGIAPAAPNSLGVSEDIGLAWARDKIVVAQILEVMPHPNADRLVLADVDFGAREPHRVVTGAPNLFAWKGQGRLARGPKVVFAAEGAQLYDGHAEGQKLMTLKGAKIRGIYSNAMVCSEKELGLSGEHEGVIILDPDAPTGMALADYMGEAVLHIEILPNIARCQSIIGVAREVAALTGAPFKGTSQARLRGDDPSAEHRREPAPDPSRGPVERRPATGWARIEIDDPDLCPRYSAALVRDVHIGPSPQWMQRRLKLAGMRPINNIVDITNYVMLEWGQPLHAFDYDKLTARAGGQPPRIIMRRARAGERMTTLDGVDRALTTDMLMITDSAGPIAVAGVMGGAETEIDARTTNVLIEAANFNYINNRRTAAALKLPSEATARFGRGVPPAHTIPAAERAVSLMRQLAGGAAAPDIADVYPGQQPPATIHFKPREIERLLGVSVPGEQVAAILRSLDFAVRDGDDGLLVTVPEHRLDVSIPADLVEEVGRVIGYDRIPPTLLDDELPPQHRNDELEAEDRLRDLLVSAGLQEVIAYALTTVERESLLYPDPSQADLDPASYVRIANPISPERAVMRHTLMASLLDTLREALRHRERVLLFEVSRIFVAQAGQPLPVERRRLCIALAGPREPQSWLLPAGMTGGGRLDFHDLKGIVDGLIQRLHLPDARTAPAEHPTFHPARAATLNAGGQLLGVFGEVHPLVREHFDLPADPVCLAEFDLEALTPLIRLPKFIAPPRFPAIREDIAVVVDDDVPAARVESVIRKAGGQELRSVTLFDLYRGEQVGAGKKSLAYALTYQHDERTLTDEEAARVRGRIVKRLRDEIEAELRA